MRLYKWLFLVATLVAFSGVGLAATDDGPQPKSTFSFGNKISNVIKKVADLKNIEQGKIQVVKPEPFKPSQLPGSVNLPAKKPTVAQAEVKPVQTIRPATQTIKPKKQKARGKTSHVSLDFQNIDTRALLQILAKAAHLNFVISDTVKGTMSINLKNIYWKNALEIILKANGLGQRRLGDAILIAPVTEIADNEIRELQAKQRIMQIAPLKSEIIQLKYASAEEMANILKGQQSSLLSPRGQVSFDKRTNSLWVRDIKSNVVGIRPYIQKLDKPAKQVLIEARITNVDKNYAQDLGVKFGITNTSSTNLSGTFAGANQIAGGGLADTGINRLNFNLPAVPPNGVSPGSIAVALMPLGGSAFLDLELSALETEGHARTLSSPRLITSNQQPAYIQQGEEIPYLEASSSGATSVEFKKAVLSMEITPQITPDKNIILHLKVTQNTRGEQIRISTAAVSPLLPPAINTRELESRVFLHDGQTLVVGGIYEKTRSNVIQRIPFLGELPIIGILFRNRAYRTRKTELMIFLTPKIIVQQPFKRSRIYARG